MSADVLLAQLQAAGLNVIEEPGWKTRGGTWGLSGVGPVGICEHHTAPPNPYPIKRLYNGQIKCNMATHENGTVYLVAYRSCNYSTGPGSSVVLDDVLLGNPITENAGSRGLVDDMGGNRYFWNVESSHPGDGSPIPQVQLDAIIESTRVVRDYWGLETTGVISHAEWTRRKIDPRWNGDNRTAIEQIREGVDSMPILSPEAQQWYEDSYQKQKDVLRPPTSIDWIWSLIKKSRDESDEGEA